MNPRLILITITVMLGMSMAIIDGSIVNVALGTIAGNLGGSLDEASWVATGYLLASVVTMPLNGWLTARFGRKHYYAACIAVFTVASLLCGTAHSILQLTLYRVVQGFGGGALQPTAQAVLFESFPPDRRANATALFGIGAMVGPAVGPILGGWIVDNASWPLIFLINVPLGIAAFFMTLAFVPDAAYHERAQGRFDWTALAFLATGLAGVQYVLERGEHDDWFNSNLIVALSAGGAVALGLFCLRTLRQAKPLVNLRLFAHATFSFGTGLLSLLGFALYGTSLILPLFFQNIMGMTAFDSAMALLPGAFAMALAMIATRFTGALHPRVQLGIPLGLVALSCWLLGFLSADSGYAQLFWPIFILRFAMGLLFVPLTQMSLSALPKAQIADGTGVAMLLRQLGGSFGIAILTTLLARHTAIARAALASGITQTHGFALGALTAAVEQTASVLAYNYLFQVCAVVFALSAIAAACIPTLRAPASAPA